MRARRTHNDTATLASDSRSMFSFTPAKIVPCGDRSEHFCYRVMSQIIDGQGRPDSLGYG